MLEIERKYLIDLSKWTPKVKGKKITQGYLSTDIERTVRVRIVDRNAYITIKGKNVGITRLEFEYSIPVSDALILMKMCLNTPIEKTRYVEKHKDNIWEIDFFEGDNMGLIVAEIELEDENQKFDIPDWVVKEVSLDMKYTNSYLSENPYRKW